MCGIEPYALAGSSHTTVRSHLSAFVSCISWLKMLVCSTHPENPGIAPFCEDVSTYSLAVIYVVNLLAKTEKKILHSTLRSEIVLNGSIVLESFSLGTKHLSAFFQVSGITPFFHSFLISSQNLRRSFGHFLYSFYDNPLGPGAEPALAFLTISCTSFHVGSLSSKATSGCFSGSTLGQSPRGVSRCSSV